MNSRAFTYSTSALLLSFGGVAHAVQDDCGGPAFLNPTTYVNAKEPLTMYAQVTFDYTDIAIGASGVMSTVAEYFDAPPHKVNFVNVYAASSSFKPTHYLTIYAPDGEWEIVSEVQMEVFYFGYPLELWSDVCNPARGYLP